MSKNTIKITAAHRQVTIDIDDLLYVVVQDRKSKLCFGHADPILTNLSIRKLHEMLPADQFVLINKGVLISLRHLVDIDQLDYRMSDGTVLRARVKTSSQHNWQMRMRVLENQYGTQQMVYEMLDDDVSFAVVRILQDDTSQMEVLYCNSAWEEAYPFVAQHNKGAIASEAYSMMQDVAYQGGIRTLKGRYFRAVFLKCDAGVCACMLRKMDVE